MADLVQHWTEARAAEVCWVGPTGPVGVPVVPLLLGGRPCAALPYSTYDDVAHLGTAGVAAFAVTQVDGADEAATGNGQGAAAADRQEAAPDPRAGGMVREGAVAVGRVHVQHDVNGSLFLDDLVDQEIAKYPPTRRLAESAWAQREHWWWVGRMIVVLTAIEVERSLPARNRSHDAVLVRDLGGRPAVDVVSAQGWPERKGPMDLFSRDGKLLEGRGGQAQAWGYNRSPGEERWELWHRDGHLDGEELRVTEAIGRPRGRLPALTPWAWFRHRRALARNCKRGIAMARAATKS